MADERTAEELAADHSKDELAAAAAVEGVEVKSKDTKADIAAKLVAGDGPAVASPHPGNHGQTIVGNVQRRSDEDAILGSFVDVVGGEHQGRFGHFFDVADSEQGGLPKTVLVRTRDEFNEVLRVLYSHLRPSRRAGGR